MLRAPLPSILVKTAPEPRAMSIAVFLALRGGFSDELKSRWNRVFCTLDGIVPPWAFFILFRKINLQEIQK